MAERALVDASRHGAVAVLALAREEKLNALSTAVERQLLEHLSAEDVLSSACVIVTGRGRAFSAGADVSEFRDQDPAAVVRYYEETGGVYERVADLPQPTIAAIGGYCLGGGLELALACDFRVAEASASFGFPEVGIGIVPSSGGTHRLVRLVGPARAKELILLRDRFGAEEALELGLVTEVVPDGQALVRSLELGERLAGLPQLAVRLAKQAAGVMPEASREAGILIERLAYGALAQSEDAQEAVTAFLEKRPPRSGGR